MKTTYIFEHCQKQTNKNYFFTIIFDYLSVEALTMLLFILKNYSFIKLKKAQFSVQKNNELESNFQLNHLLTKIKTMSSNLCLLIATNTRYEGSTLNLSLRQRILKKNFKCVLIGSLVNLTFPVTFLGSNLSTFKTITEGNNFMCQNFNSSTNPFIICNNKLFERNDSSAIYNLFKFYFHLNLFNKT